MSNTIIKCPDDYVKMKMVLEEIGNTPPTVQKNRGYKSCCALETIPARQPDIVNQLSGLRITVPSKNGTDPVQVQEQVQEQVPATPVPNADDNQPWYKGWLVWRAFN